MTNTQINTFYSNRSTRMFSVELEVNSMDYTEAHRALTTFGVTDAVRNAVAFGRYRTTHNPNVWVAATDCTVGAEIKTNPSKDLLALKDGCDALKNANATVAANCGAHINIDAGDFNLEDYKRLAKLWCKYERLILSLAPRNREDSGYARANYRTYGHASGLLWDRIDQCGDMSSLRRLVAPARECNMNLTHSDELTSSRVEFRFMGGSLNATKLASVIKLLCIMMDSAKAGNSVNFDFVNTIEDGAATWANLFEEIYGYCLNGWNMPVCPTADTIGGGDVGAPRRRGGRPSVDPTETETDRGMIWRALDAYQEEYSFSSASRIRGRLAGRLADRIADDTDIDRGYVIAQVAAWRANRVASPTQGATFTQAELQETITLIANPNGVWGERCERLISWLERRSANRR